MIDVSLPGLRVRVKLLKRSTWVHVGRGARMVRLVTRDRQVRRLCVAVVAGAMPVEALLDWSMDHGDRFAVRAPVTAAGPA
jgi:hypothetical protein